MKTVILERVRALRRFKSKLMHKRSKGIQRIERELDIVNFIRSQLLTKSLLSTLVSKQNVASLVGNGKFEIKSDCLSESSSDFFNQTNETLKQPQVSNLISNDEDHSIPNFTQKTNYPLNKVTNVKPA
jgi:hypothetical protein